jgi:peptidoglycan biosynthesis protein MviN/MurJ (putative lipid II flippase)
LFVIFFYCTQIRQLFCTVRDAAGVWHETRFIPLISAVVNIVLNIIMVNFIGLPGVILSSIISCCSVGWPGLLRNIFKVVYKQNIKDYLDSLLKYFVIIVISVFLTNLICRLIDMSDIFGLVIKCFFSFLIPNIVWFVVLHNESQFVESLSYLKKFINGLKNI